MANLTAASTAMGGCGFASAGRIAHSGWPAGRGASPLWALRASQQLPSTTTVCLRISRWRCTKTSLPHLDTHAAGHASADPIAWRQPVYLPLVRRGAAQEHRRGAIADQLARLPSYVAKTSSCAWSMIQKKRSASSVARRTSGSRCVPHIIESDIDTTNVRDNACPRVFCHVA
jgi:hypothetical protein